MAPGAEILNVLIVNSRFPWPSYKGYQIRAAVWLDALRGRANVTFVSPGGPWPSSYQDVRFVEAHRSAGALTRSAVTVSRRSLPLNTLIAARWNWSDSLVRAEQTGGPFDVAIVILSRLDPWVRSRVRAARKVLDAIDSLSLSTEERSRAARGALRLFWSFEAGRMRRLERTAVAHYDRIVTVSDTDAARFGDRVEVISNGVSIEPLTDCFRFYDCAFWGRLRYFANRDAARRLLSEVWPSIRSARPQATLLIAGADAPQAIRRFHGRDGITVQSPVPDMRSLVRRVKVALFPVTFGSGVSTKVMEAAEAGCALVATPEAVRGLDPLAAAANIASDNQALALSTIDLLAAPHRIQSMGLRLRETVATYYSRDHTLTRLAQLIGA